VSEIEIDTECTRILAEDSRSCSSWVFVCARFVWQSVCLSSSRIVDCLTVCSSCAFVLVRWSCASASTQKLMTEVFLNNDTTLTFFILWFHKGGTELWRDSGRIRQTRTTFLTTTTFGKKTTGHECKKFGDRSVSSSTCPRFSTSNTNLI
jgi:hypothetical protein